MSVLRVKKLVDHAVLPQRANATDCAYDLWALDSGYVNKGGQSLISLGIAVAIPDNCVGIIKGRSGLSCKYGLNVGAGVIDSGYRGELKVLLQAPQRGFGYTRGERIAQLLIMPVQRPEVLEVEFLDVTDRGENGFGSTGKAILNLGAAKLEI